MVHSIANGASSPALDARDLSKHYGGIQALSGASVTIHSGEIHALLGENGAGKSTAVKVVAGVVRPDEGSVHINGHELTLGSPHGSRAAGVAVVYQELSLVPQFSVMHNLVLSDFPRGRAGLLSMGRAESLAEEALGRLGLVDIDPRTPVSQLSLDQRQMVEIAKATMGQPEILILDEATSSLGDAEVDRLFELVRGLRDAGTTVVVITHRMQEVWALADSMTILRDGRTVGRFNVGEIGQGEVVSLMAGRDVHAVYPPKLSVPRDDPALELQDVRLRRGQSPWHLTVNRGEILGLGGLQGQGQRHFLHWLFGAQPGHGTILRNGARVKIRRPADALRHGIVLIPEDRAIEGLHLMLPVRWNLAMATLGRRAWLGVMNMRAERALASDRVARMSIKASSPFQAVSALSGGTQQKVVVGKFMEAKPEVILFVDATRGIDVQTKFEFYEMLRELANDGAACVLYSSDTAELVGLCDRIAVFHDGEPALMLEASEITQDAVVAASFAVARSAE